MHPSGAVYRVVKAGEPSPAPLELLETESTTREERDRLLAEQSEAEQRRGFWARLFGG